MASMKWTESINPATAIKSKTSAADRAFSFVASAFGATTREGLAR